MNSGIPAVEGWREPQRNIDEKGSSQRPLRSSCTATCPVGGLLRAGRGPLDAYLTLEGDSSSGQGGPVQTGCSGGLRPELKAERLILLAPTAG